MNYSRLKTAVVGMAATFTLLLLGCGGSDGGATTGATSGERGTLAVRMSDAPDPGITALNLTLSRVEANIDGQWTEIPMSRTTIDLLDFVDNDVVIASGDVPTGHYNQVRVFVESATVTDADGTHDVTIPSAAQTGIKLNVNYDISPNKITALLMDFNVDKSLHKTGSGNYMLQPVIPVVVKVLSGTITGTVLLPGGGQATFTDVSAIYTAGPNYPIGTEVNTSNTRDDGTFKIWALLPGTYRLEFTRVDGDTTLTATVTDVTVTANENTNIGAIELD